MKNKVWVGMIVAAIFGVFLVAIVLVLNNIFNGENLIFSSLAQGEVMAGLVIAPPTIVTWYFSSEQNREEKKKVVSDNVRDTVQYYDKQLTEVVSDVSKSKDLPFHKARKIEYIIETYNKLLKEWSETTKLDISLDFVQVLSAICSIKYPEEIESPNDEDADNWKNNLGTALKPTLKEVISLEKNEVFKSKEIKYFSYIEFGSEGYELENIEFSGKHFIQCTFSSNFLYLNNFKNCTFINCSISEGKPSVKFKQELLDNNIRGTFKDENDEDILKKGALEVLNVESKERELKHGHVFDAREGIVADDYIIGNKFFELTSVEESRLRIYEDIVGQLVSKLGIDTGVNNKKISISKNYITEDNKQDFIEGSLFSGWNSLFESKIKKANNFNHYIFCIKVEDNYNTIVFEKEKFIEFLKRKNIDKVGKYNFYFQGFKDAK